MSVPSPHYSVRESYEARIRSGALDEDPAQAPIVQALDALATTLQAHRPARSPGMLGRLFGHKEEPAPRGLYVWGGVGRGKTMLMDIFFEALAVERKRRVHFHAYMADVHGRIHAWRQALKAGEVEGDDPIRPVAEALAREAWVLCFDEFVVTDIADAMILGRLFTVLFEKGVVVVATSNVPPTGLYREGLNRALFLPFVALLEDRMEVRELTSPTDHRLEKIGDTPVYYAPADHAARAALDALFARLAGGVAPGPATLAVQGRDVVVARQAPGIARFAFEEICERPLGASDYLAIARAYETVILDDVPVLSADQRNAARRFITLVDVLYERHVKLFLSAAAEPDDLYRAETGTETFEFARTASRLHEMRSREYLEAPRAPPDAGAGRSTGLVET